MAVLDIEHGVIVIRIVYDGPPEAGKTTSLRALSVSLGRPRITPEQAGDRTLFFDWVDYTGGLFEGHQIRCQIVTVPGQTVLTHRRHALLETADVVVFVGDSAPAAMASTKAYLGDMRKTLDRLSGPRVGVILQANKRDRIDAVPLDAIRAEIPGIAVLESVATEGRGVREAFVFAVRLALDRVREFLRERTLRLAKPDVQSSDDLVVSLMRQESERVALASSDEGEESVARSALQEVIEEQNRAIADAATVAIMPPEERAPHPPSIAVPVGMIWPPLDGRVLLLEACAAPFTPRRLPHGDWIGEVPGWRFHSPNQACYVNPEMGRRGLVEWARLHALAQRWLSNPRIVVLAATGQGTWRLWQIVKTEETLRDVLVRKIEDGSPAALLRRLLDSGRQLLAATETLHLTPFRLPVRIDTVGAQRGVPVYVSFLPDPFLVRPGQPINLEQRAALLRRELGALASSELSGFARESFPAFDSILRENDPPAVVDAIRDILRDAGLMESDQPPATGGMNASSSPS